MIDPAGLALQSLGVTVDLVLQPSLATCRLLWHGPVQAVMVLQRHGEEEACSLRATPLKPVSASFFAQKTGPPGWASSVCTTTWVAARALHALVELWWLE